MISYRLLNNMQPLALSTNSGWDKLSVIFGDLLASPSLWKGTLEGDLSVLAQSLPEQEKAGGKAERAVQSATTAPTHCRKERSELGCL